MKKHQETDRIIKEKMEQYSMETPMHLFAGIAEALDADAAPISAPQKSSGRKGYWLLALLVLVVGGSGVWFLTSDDNSSKAVGSEMSIRLNANDVETALGKTEKIDNESLVNTAVEISNSKTEINNTSSVNSNHEVVNGKAETTNPDLNVSSESSFRNTNIVNSNPNPNTSFKTTPPQNIFTQKGEASETEAQSTSSVSNLLNTQEVTGTINKSLEEKPIAVNSSENITTTKKVIEEVFNLPRLDQRANSSIYHSSPYRLAVEPTCGLKPDGSKIRFTTSVDLFFSPDYANQILEYKSEDFRDHAQLRTDTEKPYYSFNTGVRVNFLTEFGWAIRTGLVYTQINDILETQYTEIVTTLDANGNVIGTTEGTRDVNIRNKYKMIDIPVIFGYEVPMKKFDLNVNGGVYLNLMSKQSGAFFSPLEDRVVYFTEGHPDDYDIFKNNIGLSVFMGLGFNFDLTSTFNASKKTQLIVEPHARFYPKSFALDNYILNQKYFSTGVMIGLRRDL